jgi:hypothetical protein
MLVTKFSTLPCLPPPLAPRATGRKLLQPFTLGLKEGGRRSGNVGNTGERRTNGLAFTTAGLLDSESLASWSEASQDVPLSCRDQQLAQPAVPLTTSNWCLIGICTDSVWPAAATEHELRHSQLFNNQGIFAPQHELVTATTGHDGCSTCMLTSS